MGNSSLRREALGWMAPRLHYRLLTYPGVLIDFIFHDVWFRGSIH
jgi:hypothetical protein